MSLRYKGAVISATPPTLVAGAGASGAWTLQQQMQAIASGYWPVNGPFYIEEVFSTYLYTGNGSTQTITNGIDLSTYGGLVWVKNRSTAGTWNDWFDTARGATKLISSNQTDAQATVAQSLTAFTSSGFSVGTDSDVNENTKNIVSWTFRKQPKFFDVVTYTGNGTTQTISHSLGSVPGFIIVKRTNSAEDWWCFHRYDFTYRFKLNATNAAVNTTSVKYLGNNVIDVAPTSTTFTVGDTGGLNGSGDSFVAYLFAHDAGGFGLTGTDNVISCGSYTGLSTGRTVTLGYEPQWVLVKKTNATSNWYLLDNMRGMTTYNSAGKKELYPNTSGAEVASADTAVSPTATGFTVGGGGMSDNGDTYIYIAIRRGPMKTPTSGTSVFAPETATASTGTSRTIGFPADMSFGKARTITANNLINDRLRGYANSNTTAPSLFTNATSAESTATSANVYNVWNTTALDGAYFNGNSTIWYHFRRAPGFFDVVCYTGTAVARNVTHNLTVAPELMIVRRRSGATEWFVYSATLGVTKYLWLQSTNAEAAATSGIWNSTTPTASVFSLGNDGDVNGSGDTYVAYLFATVAGVSKVGSYTGTGTTLQVDCGFTGGARFVLIKRTDSTGGWYVWDSARGIVAGNDPYLLINSSAAEVTNTDYVDTYSAGFEISSTAPAAINANGGSFVFLAIA